MPVSLVTGGAGFIGSHVVDYLLAMNHHVVVLDDLSGGEMDNINKGADFVKGSVVDYNLVNSLFVKYKFDYVFHLAAYAAEGLSHFIKRFNYTNNIIGSVNVINAAVNCGAVKCFVYTSSIAVYGANQVPMTEDMPPNPEDPYGIAKYAVEQDLHETYKMFGMPFIIFRPHNVYGERQNINDKYRNVIGIFMNQAMRGQSFTIFGDGKQKRAFSYINDIAPIIAHSCEKVDAYNQIFNIGADMPYTINHLAKVVADCMNVKLKVCRLEERKEVKYTFSSHVKVKEYFGGFSNNFPLEIGIRRMSDWAKSREVKAQQLFSNVEVEKNMPSSWKEYI